MLDLLSEAAKRTEFDSIDDARHDFAASQLRLENSDWNNPMTGSRHSRQSGRSCLRKSTVSKPTVTRKPKNEH